MPKQYVVCGRPVPRLGTRHVSLLLVLLALFAVFSLLFTLPSAGPTRPSLPVGHKFSMPKSLKSPWMNKLNPFKQPSHPPHRQKDDTDGDSWWYSDWNWLRMPFSSSVTLDENRALLPMLKERTPIYCYYDNTADKDRPSKDAESDLLLAWRRAWWAKGFKPIILSPAEAMNNPLYEEMQKLPDLTPELNAELMRWLAWENMGDGLLAHHRLFPMGPHGDPLLTFLRRGEFPALTRFKGLDDGLFVGSKGEVAAVIKAAMASPKERKAQDIVAAVESDKKENPFSVDDTPKSLAYYSARQIESSYAKVGKAIAASHAAGLKSLTQLIGSHLHQAWQDTFTDGISVVKPLPQHTTYLITPAYELAQRLAHCPESPLPDTCPPNRPSCRPCDDSRPMKITTPSSYSVSPTVYTIGTVPHPYTSSTLNSLKPQLSIRWIRRESPRDAWITSLTSSLFTDTISTTPRLIRFKEAVASDDNTPAAAEAATKAAKGTISPPAKGGAVRSLWLPAEQPLPDDIDWHFGFALPDRATYATSNTDPSALTAIPMHSSKDGPLPTKDDLTLEPNLLSHAQTVVLLSPSSPSSRSRKFSPVSQDEDKQGKEDLSIIRDAVEAWNLADTEAWRFARAYLARQSVERKKWEAEEKGYVGGMGSEKKAAVTKGKKEKESGKDKDTGDGGAGSDEGKEKEGGKRTASNSASALRGAWSRWLDRD